MMIQIAQETGPAPFTVVMNSNRYRRNSEHDRTDSDTHTVLVQCSLLRYFSVATRAAGMLKYMSS